MKKVFLDANILIDLMDETRSVDPSITSFMFEADKECLYMSPLSVHIAFYVLKIKPNTQICKDMQLFLETINLIPLTESIAKRSVSIDFPNFEDCLQYFSALDYCDYILTRDKKDFEKIKELSPSRIQIVSNCKDIRQ